MLATVAARCAIRRSTGLVGLAFNHGAREDLISLYNQTLEATAALPEGIAYRQDVEATTRFRLGVVSGAGTREEIEAQIGCGQLEELIEQAEDELELIPNYAKWELWRDPPVAELEGSS